MAKLATRWQDDRGFLHESEEAADNANAAFEREGRREAVRQLLTERMSRTRPTGRRIGAGPFDTTAQAVEWLIDNWPAIKAIGFSYRVDELGASGGAAIPDRPLPLTGEA